MTVFKCKKDFFVSGTATAIFVGQLFMVEDIFNLPMPEGKIGEYDRADFWENAQLEYNFTEQSAKYGGGDE